MRVILICGSRSWTNPRPIGIILDRLLEETDRSGLLIVQGGATGVDLLAEAEAHSRGIHSARVAALWDSYGRAAGPIRNSVMLALRPERVIAFHFNYERLRKAGSGTGRCIEQANVLRIPVSLKLVSPEVADRGQAGWTAIREARAAKKARKRS